MIISKMNAVDALYIAIWAVFDFLHFDANNSEFYANYSKFCANLGYFCVNFCAYIRNVKAKAHPRSEVLLPLSGRWDSKHFLSPRRRFALQLGYVLAGRSFCESASR